MSNDFIVGDSGINIILYILQDDGTPFDVSTATVKQIIFVTPHAVVIPKDASFVTDGSDGRIRYTINSTDFIDSAGRWLVYAYVSGPGYNRTSSKTWFSVRES